MIELILHSYLMQMLCFGFLVYLVKIYQLKTHKKVSILFIKPILTTLAAASTYFICQPFAQSGELDVGYDSLYIGEGRNKLEEGGIAWIQLSHEIDTAFSLVGLYGAGEDYDEMKLSLVYAKTVSEVDYYISLTRIEFFQDNLNDNELGLGAAYTFLTSVPFTLAADALYSNEARGAFVELSLKTDVDLNPDLTLTPYIKTGLDYGYASDGKTGHNHSAFGAVFAFRHSDSLSFNLSLEHSTAGSHVVRETSEKNHSWFGLHLVYSY